MADRTPQLEELRKWLLEDDANVEAFKADPKPHLDRHNVPVTDDEVDNVRTHLADKDAATIKMGLTPPAMATMFSQKK